ncbi:MAG: hypothetical protein PHQ23_00135 [Candidatus Wallbacteria bacterium]|nr:hypothetical protein [Candidatus Wallbacteria bacterium]
MRLSLRSLLRELFFLPNNGEFLETALSAPAITVFLAFLGLARILMEVWFGIVLHPKVYTLQPDIVFCMMVFTVYLCWFGSASLHFCLKLFQIHVKKRSLLALIFHLQMIHLIIPPVDYLGLKIGVPWYFFSTRYEISWYWLPGLVLPLGHLCAWVVTWILLIRVLIIRMKLPMARTLAGSVLAFNALYWPIYHLWPLFNTIFNFLAGLPNDPFNGYFWGYGLFFLISAAAGMVYIKRV